MSPKQRRYLEATEAQRGYVPGAGSGRASVAPTTSVAPISLPGGAVKSGSYMASTKFKSPSMLPMRKVRT